MISEEKLKKIFIVSGLLEPTADKVIQDLITSHRELSRALEVARGFIKAVQYNSDCIKDTGACEVDDGCPECTLTEALNQINQITKGSGE